MTFSFAYPRLPGVILFCTLLAAPLVSATPVCPVSTAVLILAAEAAEGEDPVAEGGEVWCCCGACCGYAVDCLAIPGCDSC